jgi:hypothetical protein
MEGIAAGPDGAIYLPYERRVFKLGATATKVPVKTTPYGSLTGLAFSTSKYGIAKSIDGVSMFLPADKLRVYKAGRDFDLGSVRAAAVDEQGRVWITAEAGLAVIPLEGEAAEFRSGAFEEIAGTIFSMHVVGDGPPLPHPGDVKKGTLVGNVQQDGAPVVGAKLELCPSPSVVYTRTPCHGAPLRLQSTTDAEGKFEFEDVPLGAYGLAVKTGRQWQTTLIPDLGSRMSAGQAYDVGTLQLEAAK